MSDTAYAEAYRNIDFRANPESYPIGRGEQGVLMAEPYKSEILPHWRFKTVAVAQESSKKLEAMFNAYLDHNDFVGADMARKFIQMGWTRARRYANHASGTKYDSKGKVKPQESDALESEKAKAAAVFKEVFDRVRVNEKYLAMKTKHKEIHAFWLESKANDEA